MSATITSATAAQLPAQASFLPVHHEPREWGQRTCWYVLSRLVGIASKSSHDALTHTHSHIYIYIHIYIFTYPSPANQNTGGSYDVGLWQINDMNWSQCSGGSAPCDGNSNLECAKKVFAWGGNTWKLWATCGACGACNSA